MYLKYTFSDQKHFRQYPFLFSLSNSFILIFISIELSVHNFQYVTNHCCLHDLVPRSQGVVYNTKLGLFKLSPWFKQPLRAINYFL